MPRSILLALFGVIGWFGCRAAGDDFVVGGLYSIEDEESGYRVAKVLAVDDSAVHIRVYKNHFTRRPSKIPSEELVLGAYDDPEGMSVGHIPLTRNAFADWRPRLIAVRAVSEEELEGYRYWQESAQKMDRARLGKRQLPASAPVSGAFGREGGQRAGRRRPRA